MHGTVRDGGAHPDGALWCGGFSYFMDGLSEYSRKAYMGRWQILVHMERERTDRRCFHTSRNGAVRVSGRRPASMDRSGMSGGCEEMHTESGEAKCEIAIYRLRI